MHNALTCQTCRSIVTSAAYERGVQRALGQPIVPVIETPANPARELLAATR